MSKVSKDMSKVSKSISLTCETKELKMKIKVQNMISPCGNPVVNQFMITSGDYEYFQSYDTIIVKHKISTGEICLDAMSWNCSVTTSKYRNWFLGEHTQATKKKIADGTYTLRNLN